MHILAFLVAMITIQSCVATVPMYWESIGESDQKTYYVNTLEERWFDARAEAISRGGDIVSIHSEEEYNNVTSFLFNNAHRNKAHWVGMFYNKYGDSVLNHDVRNLGVLTDVTLSDFQWVDGSSVDAQLVQKWAPGYPNPSSGLFVEMMPEQYGYTWSTPPRISSRRIRSIIEVLKCAENEHVSNSQCVSCPNGLTRPAGDAPNEGDTACTDCDGVEGGTKRMRGKLCTSSTDTVTGATTQSLRELTPEDTKTEMRKYKNFFSISNSDSDGEKLRKRIERRRFYLQSSNEYLETGRTGKARFMIIPKKTLRSDAGDDEDAYVAVKKSTSSGCNEVFEINEDGLNYIIPEAKPDCSDVQVKVLCEGVEDENTAQHVVTMTGTDSAGLNTYKDPDGNTLNVYDTDLSGITMTCNKKTFTFQLAGSLSTEGGCIANAGLNNNNQCECNPGYYGDNCDIQIATVGGDVCTELAYSFDDVYSGGSLVAPTGVNIDIDKCEIR